MAAPEQGFASFGHDMRLALLFQWLRRLVFIAGFAGIALLAFAVFRPAPQNLPWTPLRLDQPIGMFTPRKLVELGHSRPACLALLKSSGVRFEAIPAHGDQQCRATNAVRLSAGQQILPLSPAAVAPSCPMMTGLLLWQTHVLQPLALRQFGASVARIEHYGSYSCRRLYGRSAGGWSEHASANAIDISAVVLSDGTRISVLRDWPGSTEKGRFLRAARDGACSLFSTVLSPDYNAAHRDHLHIDLADRGEMGWRACR
jgi:hypothetical protein